MDDLEYPLGAIVNGETCFGRIDAANYENDEQFLSGSDEMNTLRAAFFSLCDYAENAKAKMADFFVSDDLRQKLLDENTLLINTVRALVDDMVSMSDKYQYGVCPASCDEARKLLIRKQL